MSEILVDTDAGVDDMLALFLLFRLVQAGTVDLAVSFGNMPRAQAIRNVRLFSIISRFQPRCLFEGRAAPLLGDAHFALNVHGEDGLGGVTATHYRDLARSITNEAVTLERIEVSYQKIIALGPLTDIASTANAGLRSPPLFVMGGAFDVPGNVSPVAEFNFFSDPHAASDVFDCYPGEIFVVPLDVTRQVVLKRTYFDEICAANPTRTVVFLREIHQHYMAFHHQRRGIDGCYPHDALAVCAAFFPDLFVWDRGRVHVEPEGTERGRSVFEPDAGGPHQVARRIATARFFEILEAAIGGDVGPPEANAPGEP
jgi:inosine-uridine nucleoside N-ribohydrolase